MISARNPDSLPAPAALRRLCQGLARLDRALDPEPIHYFNGGAFFIDGHQGNLVEIAFTKKGVVILGFSRNSPMSPARNGGRTWPGVIDDVPFRREVAGFPFGKDITFCIWRLATERRWQSGKIRRPRARDADGSASLLAMLGGNPRSFRRYARYVYEREVPLDVIERAYAGGAIDLARITPVKRKTFAPPANSRFDIGDRVMDAWGGTGTITAVWNGIAAAAGMIGDVTGWLRGLSIKPKTPRQGVWYSVRPDSGGAMLAGELDLQGSQ